MEKITIQKFLELRESCEPIDCSQYVIIGKSKLREYKIWKGIKNRVTNPNRYDADHYFNKGINCSDEWFNCFEQFYYDLGPCPNKDSSVDRINNDLGYCKENCRWASKTEQTSNRGEFNCIFTYNGESKVLKEWARIFNIKYTTLYTRIYRSNMSFEEAINFNNELIFTINSETHTLKEWCKIYNIEHDIVYNRYNKHKWSIEEALSIPKGGRRKKK